MIKIKLKVLSVGKDLEQVEFAYMAIGEDKIIHLCWKIVCQFLMKSLSHTHTHTETHTTVIPLLGIHSRQIKICLSKYLDAKCPQLTPKGMEIYGPYRDFIHNH